MTDKYVDINNVRTEQMRQKWQQIIDLGIDPFDRAEVEKWVGPIVMESEHWYSFENNYQYNDTRCQPVMVSNQFFDDFVQVPAHILADAFVLAGKLREKYQITGGGFVMRFGDTELSGASVVHLHAQLVVPKEGKQVAAWFGSEKK